MFSILLLAARDILNNVVYTANFLTTITVQSIRRNREPYLCLCSIACKKRKTDWMLNLISIFNNKM